MVRHAIIDMTTSTGHVVNVIDYDTDISGTVPPGMDSPMVAIASTTAQIGWLYQDGEFVNPNAKPPPIGTSKYDWGPRFVETIGRY